MNWEAALIWLAMRLASVIVTLLFNFVIRKVIDWWGRKGGGSSLEKRADPPQLEKSEETPDR